jgi:predicted transcriptional regulator
MQKNDTTETETQIALYAKALAHPTRVAILNFLVSLDSCYFGEIHNELPISKATVSQHLTELKNAGLIQGTIEFPKVKYCVCPEKWAEAKKMFETFFKKSCKRSGLCK